MAKKEEQQKILKVLKRKLKKKTKLGPKRLKKYSEKTKKSGFQKQQKQILNVQNFFCMFREWRFNKKEEF